MLLELAVQIGSLLVLDMFWTCWTFGTPSSGHVEVVAELCISESGLVEVGDEL